MKFEYFVINVFTHLVLRYFIRDKRNLFGRKKYIRDNLERRHCNFENSFDFSSSDTTTDRVSIENSRDSIGPGS